eukprot:GHVH01011872.1.p1 GENE.GHVH01011872.1~~GHVH01011872.1.p1  ORF type:complete len:326 (-),score=80.97 GHVH01011872.1:3-878(-)
MSYNDGRLFQSTTLKKDDMPKKKKKKRRKSRGKGKKKAVVRDRGSLEDDGNARPPENGHIQQYHERLLELKEERQKAKEKEKAEELRRQQELQEEEVQKRIELQKYKHLSEDEDESFEEDDEESEPDVNRPQLDANPKDDHSEEEKQENRAIQDPMVEAEFPDEPLNLNGTPEKPSLPKPSDFDSDDEFRPVESFDEQDKALRQIADVKRHATKRKAVGRHMNGPHRKNRRNHLDEEEEEEEEEINDYGRFLDPYQGKIDILRAFDAFIESIKDLQTDRTCRDDDLSGGWR